jgi:hypothetical protein
LYGGIPAIAFADCNIGITSATCDNSPPNPYNRGVGNGTQNNYLVTVEGGTSTSNAAEVSPQNKEAIAINNGGTINIGNYATVSNRATSSGGSLGRGTTQSLVRDHLGVAHRPASRCATGDDHRTDETFTAGS